MNDYQKAKKNSFDLIVKVGEEYPQVISLVPRFASTFATFKLVVNKIAELGIQQAVDITGIADDKDTLMDELIHQVVDISGAIHSYAIFKDDKTLAAKVNYKEWTVEKMSLTDLLNAAAIVLEEAQKIAPEELTNEGITVAEIAEFKSDYEQLNAGSANIRSAIINRASYTQQIADLFTEAADLKKNTLDRLSTQFQRKSPEFYQKYKAASNVIIKRSPKTAAETPTAAV
jgi:pyruvate/2-oxoglutarate dehydrogenase complex dihydrolipoamide acyltransferase (E2) component